MYTLEKTIRRELSSETGGFVREGFDAQGRKLRLFYDKADKMLQMVDIFSEDLEAIAEQIRLEPDSLADPDFPYKEVAHSWLNNDGSRDYMTYLTPAERTEDLANYERYITHISPTGTIESYTFFRRGEEFPALSEHHALIEGSQTTYIARRDTYWEESGKVKERELFRPDGTLEKKIKFDFDGVTPHEEKYYAEDGKTVLSDKTYGATKATIRKYVPGTQEEKTIIETWGDMETPRKIIHKGLIPSAADPFDQKIFFYNGDNSFDCEEQYLEGQKVKAIYYEKGKVVTVQDFEKGTETHIEDDKGKSVTYNFDPKEMSKHRNLRHSAKTEYFRVPSEEPGDEPRLFFKKQTEVDPKTGHKKSTTTYWPPEAGNLIQQEVVFHEDGVVPRLTIDFNTDGSLKRKEGRHLNGNLQFETVPTNDEQTIFHSKAYRKDGSMEHASTTMQLTIETNAALLLKKFMEKIGGDFSDISPNNQTSERLGFLRPQQAIITEHTEYGPNGGRIYERDLSPVIKDGRVTSWQPSEAWFFPGTDQVKRVKQYYHTAHLASEIHFHENGEREKATFFNGTGNKEYTVFYREDGNPYMRINYDKNGIPDTRVLYNPSKDGTVTATTEKVDSGEMLSSARYNRDDLTMPLEYQQGPIMEGNDWRRDIKERGKWNGPNPGD